MDQAFLTLLLPGLTLLVIAGGSCGTNGGGGCGGGGDGGGGCGGSS